MKFLDRKKVMTLLVGCLIIMFVGIPSYCSEDPQHGGTLVIGCATNPDSWDPQKSTGIGERFWSLIYEGLVRGENGETVPVLAKSWDVTASDITFHLRQGVQFHNGQELVASDVVFCFERMKSNDPPSEESFIFKTVKSIEAFDDYTVRVSFQDYFAPFMELIGKVRIFPAKCMEGLEENPVGTGPFCLDEFVPNDFVQLRKNDAYWQEGLPYLNAVVYKILPDSTTALVAFNQQEVDMLTVDVAIPMTELKKLLQDPTIKSYRASSPSMMYLAFNTLFPPTNVRTVREATTRCVNSDLLNQVVYDGVFEPACTYLPPTSWAYDPDITIPPYSIDEAKQLFEEAGISRLIAKQPAKSFNPVWYQIVEILGEQLKKANVDLEIVPMEVGRWVEIVVPEPQEEFAFFVCPSSRLPDPDDFLSTTILNVPNYSGYQNEEVQERLRTEALSCIERADRKDVYLEMQKILVEELPIVPLLWMYEYNIAHEYVMGFQCPYLHNWLYVEKTWLKE